MRQGVTSAEPRVGIVGESHGDAPPPPSRLQISPASGRHLPGQPPRAGRKRRAQLSRVEIPGLNQWAGTFSACVDGQGKSDTGLDLARLNTPFFSVKHRDPISPRNSNIQPAPPVRVRRRASSDENARRESRLGVGPMCGRQPGNCRRLGSQSQRAGLSGSVRVTPQPQHSKSILVPCQIRALIVQICRADGRVWLADWGTVGRRLGADTNRSPRISIQHGTLANSTKKQENVGRKLDTAETLWFETERNQ